LSPIHHFLTPQPTPSAAATPATHPPLFTVNPNIEAHDALVHVALYLRCAYDTGIKALDHLRDEGRGMYWSSLHSLEMAEGLVEAMLEGIESAPVIKRRAG